MLNRIRKLRMVNQEERPITWLWHLLWLLLIALPFLYRTYLPVDETRYVAVAWEMWLRGEWLVSYLNGELYHHKPPLLFWLIHLGWWVWGVNEWWPRLLPGLFSLGCLWLTVGLAQRLWPTAAIGTWAALILLTGFLWSMFTHLVMFDVLLTFFTLCGLWALVTALTTQKIRFLGLMGLALGLGILTKGPVIVLHLLPLAVLAPWWWPSKSIEWQRWYLGLLLSVAIGISLALMWALPAGWHGGPAYQQAIFWHQSAHRLVNAFAHQHPVWWYLPWLPLILFPWLWWPALWRGLKRLSFEDKGVRFGVMWLSIGFIAFSLISGKQLHYLLPLLPGFALLSAYALVQNPLGVKVSDMRVPALVIVVLGSVLALINSYHWPNLPLWHQQLSPLAAVMLLSLGVLLINYPLVTLKQQGISLALAAVAVSVVLPSSILNAAGSAYDLKGISRYIHHLQQQGQTVAHLGDYHGQYQFLGRLQPIAVIDEYQLCAWITQHPQSLLIIYFSAEDKGFIHHVEYQQPYRSHYVGVIKGALLYSACTVSLI